MQNNSQSRNYSSIINIFMLSWLVYGVFFTMGLWLTRALVWQHVFIFAGILAFITSIAVHSNLQQATPTEGMLVRRVKKSDIERRYADNPEWKNLKQELRKDDEIWQWAAFGYTWMALGGRYGYVIVREGKLTEYFMFTEAAT